MTRRSVAVLLNCSSRSNRAAAQRARLGELLEQSGLAADLLCAEKGRDMGELARRAAQGPYDLVVAGGGDGTMSTVAAAVAGTDKAMGVLPLGTVNHFAKYLGVPLDLEGAVRTLVEGRRAQVDVGEVNGRVFVNNSTLGIYPTIVRGREALRKRSGLNKWLALALATVSGIRRHERVGLRLVLDGQELELTTPFVFVANSDFKLGDVDLARQRPPHPGELGVCVAHAGSRLSTVRLIASALAGRIQKANDFSIMRTTELRVEAPCRRLHVAADGEIHRMAPPLVYRARPSALRVVVPLSSDISAGSRRQEDQPGQFAALGG
ncbi:diacylglycerol/lipid kinase family protein [Sorangium sp. So ce854]|uniref:diacylglycerol/lipid kinase family protein n=1 Tax=Sorangium sp. So ce854 TaxID=3133322 RepID=UPI003F5F0B3A